MSTSRVWCTPAPHTLQQWALMRNKKNNNKDPSASPWLHLYRTITSSILWSLLRNSWIAIKLIFKALSVYHDHNYNLWGTLVLQFINLLVLRHWQGHYTACKNTALDGSHCNLVNPVWRIYCTIVLNLSLYVCEVTSSSWSYTHYSNDYHPTYYNQST